MMDFCSRGAKQRMLGFISTFFGAAVVWCWMFHCFIECHLTWCNFLLAQLHFGQGSIQKNKSQETAKAWPQPKVSLRKIQNFSWKVNIAEMTTCELSNLPVDFSHIRSGAESFNFPCIHIPGPKWEPGWWNAKTAFSVSVHFQRHFFHTFCSACSSFSLP